MKPFHLWESIRAAPTSLFFQAVLVALFLLPLAATLLQFASSGFLTGSAPYLVLFWPGAEWRWAPTIPVWLAMGAMSFSYVAGLWYLFQRRTLGNVVLWTIAVAVAANLLGIAVNYATGWKELQSSASVAGAGRANALIFSLWQNPIWEELVFRGIPLLMLVWVKRRRSVKSPWWNRGYIVVPSILFALYHIPGHGPARLVDTFALGCGFSWLALRYSLLAPIVVHYLLDAMLVLNLSTLPNIPAEQVQWLVQYGAVLNTSWSLLLLLALLSLPAIVAVNSYRARRGWGEATER